MEDFIKYLLLGLLMLPFVALMTDVLGKTRGVMIWVVIAVAAFSAVIAFLMGGFYQRPNVANIFLWAFLAWPLALLIAKQVNASMSWGAILGSIPIMSWYLINVSMQFYYPVHGGGGGMGMGMALIAGWLYMIIPFAVFGGLFAAGRAIAKRIRSGWQGKSLKV